MCSCLYYLFTGLCCSPTEVMVALQKQQVKSWIETVYFFFTLVFLFNTHKGFANVWRKLLQMKICLDVLLVFGNVYLMVLQVTLFFL